MINLKHCLAGCLFAVSLSANGAETVCNNNGGAGWPIPISSTTNISIPYQFGDISVAHDVDVDVDITKHYVGDLTARVTSPQGTTVLLFERPGTTLGETVASAPWGCNQDDISVIFDDEAATGTNIENVCGTGIPSISGTYLPHNASPNDLSAIDGEDPTGNWAFQLVHIAPFDPGTLNEVCITASFAAVTFDKWVSSNSSCSDQIDTLNVARGTNVYYCYVANNPGSETFSINAGNATDSLGHNISALETTYNPTNTQAVIVGPVVAGSAQLPYLATTVNNAQVTASFATANFSGTLVTGESANVTVGDPVINASTITVLDVNGGTAEPGDVLRYTITINESAGFLTSNVSLSDVVDANLSGVSITTLPAGATNGTAGNNVSITGITLSANGSAVIQFEATIAAATPVGTNINNSATITHAPSSLSFDAVAPTVIVSAPNLSTSTKTVLDVNGGAALQGDLIRYTITINETGGNPATNVSVSDVVDANLINVTVTGLPPGAVDSSSGNTISISNISVPANGSATVVFDANISGTAPTGTNINNTATLTDVSTISASPSAPTLVVGSLPASGIKQLYFTALNATPNLTRAVPGVTTSSGLIGVGNTFTLNQGITFQKAFSITGGSTVNIRANIRRRSGGGARTVRADLYRGATLIGSNTQSWNAGNYQYLTFPIAIAANQNFVAGEAVRIVFTNLVTNNIQFTGISGGNISQVQMQTGTVVNVDAINVFAAAYPSTTQYQSYTPGSTVYIRSTVSDPFGNADITAARITITDTTPTVRVNNVAMTSVATPAGATRLYEYTYVIPAVPQGFWNLSVIANEGTEGTVSHTSQSTMIVGTTSININKSSAVISDPVNATNPKAIPNAIIEYTVNVNNSGFGYADNGSMVITDPLPAGMTLFLGSPANPAQFTDGTISSGLSYTFTSLASTTDDIAFSNNLGSSFITPSVDGAGFDVTVPPINYIRINPKGAFRGSNGVNNPSFTLKFRLRVD